MLRTLVIDDEPLAVELMQGLLAQEADIQLVDTAGSGRKGLSAIRRHGPDLVFLDVEMPGLSGFDVVASLQEDDHMPLIVFVSAFDKYALEAFDVNAVDYILKPVERSRLRKTLDRARERLVRPDKAALLRVLEAGRARSGLPTPSLDAGAAMRDGREVLDRLPVRKGDVVELLPFRDIDWVDAAGDYMCVHAGGETHILRSTMKELSQRLAHGTFARIHRSTLVNLRKVTGITPLTKGECTLHLGEETQLKVSRNYRAAIQHLLN
ncbi:MAG: LytTR family DNA-binding domain-containing protein [Halieaceae bacterium]|jgi:two-component system LytT family response regulator|nr:LytTR family DNA-binding domain-containing protein [Halieaceae bacterium]